MIKITVTGDDKLSAQLRQLIGDLRGAAVEKALVAGALVIMNDAKRRAPVDTGNLRRSIHVGGHKGPETPSSGRDLGRVDYQTVQVGTNVEYAKYQEHGTSKMSARPFLRPALDSNREEAVQEVASSLKQILERL